jgi:hypothetical protein
MDMPQLDKYLVTMGIQGQDLVLSQMEKIRKTGKTISKSKINPNLSAKGGTASPSAVKGSANKGDTESVIKKTSPEKDTINRSSKELKTFAKDLGNGNKKVKQFSKEVDAGVKEQKKSTKLNKDTLNKHYEKSKEAASSLLQGATSMSPASLAHSIAKLPGALHLGTAGKIAGAGLGAATVSATGALDIAKNAVKSSYELSQRNSATTYYGGDKLNRGNMSNNEKAQLVMSVSSAFGKLQKPMQDVLNKLSPQKDTGALARVASGDWRSTGTDKGFFLQKLSDSFGDLPPSISQKFQARLLEGYGGEIQNATGIQKQTQGRTAGVEISDETKNLKINEALDQRTSQKFKDEKTGKMYEVQTSGYDALLKLNEQYNSLIVDMVKTGQSFSGVATDIAKAGSEVARALNFVAAKASNFFYRSGTNPGKQ